MITKDGVNSEYHIKVNKRVTGYTFCLIAVLLYSISRKIQFSFQENDLSKSKNASIENINLTSSSRHENITSKRPAFIPSNYPVDKLYDLRSSRRGVNAIALYNVNGGLNEQMLLSHGFSVTEINLISSLINDLRMNAFTIIHRNTRIIDEEAKLYRTEKYDREFSICISNLYSELINLVSESKANFVMEALPLEHFEGFSGKYSVNFTILPPYSRNNPHDEYAKNYWVEDGIAVMSGTRSWSQACKTTGPMTIDKNGRLVLDQD